jgi:type 1 glutamine amidotransferase
LLRRLKELNQQIFAYRVDSLRSDGRKVFEFAKAVNIPMIVAKAEATELAELEKLAEEFGINVAVENADVKALEGRGKRIGIAMSGKADVAAVKDRLMMVTVSDRVAGLSDFYLAAYKAGLKPLTVIVRGTGGADTYADLLKNLNGFEKAMWPAMTARVRAMLDTPAGKIRGGDRLPPEMRAQIDAAAPRQAIAKPKKPRKLLVTDVQMYSGHLTIPHGNLMLELMGKYTGAFEPVFSNDPDLLKYPKIKEFDAVFFNNVCGMVHNDSDVREGILRFVREGGGIGGNHAVTYANNNWPEFAEMMGGWAGAHHTEKQVIKVDDPNSPLTKSFGSASFEHTDEFYQFPMYSPYSRQKQRVLLSIDVEKSDRATAGRFCTECTRTDQDYGLAWIKEYGKGRTYFTPLGHTTIMYTEPKWTQHMLAAVQYILGDLEADATPSAKAGR